MASAAAAPARPSVRHLSSRSSSVAERVAALRELMASHEGGPIDAYVVPSEDAHQSEYVAECDKRRKFISGFTGSAGLAVILKEQCLLWTDGRYFNQAAKELTEGWRLMKATEDPLPEIWLAENLPPHSRVAVDGFTLSVDAARRFERSLHPALISLSLVQSNLVDQIWADRPPLPSAPLQPQELQFAGRLAEDKIASVRESMAAEGADALIVSALDEVAWLCNVRGGDVLFNPVAMGYVVVRRDEAVLFVDKSKVDEKVQSHLSESGISLAAYADIMLYIQNMAKQLAAAEAADGAHEAEGEEKAEGERSDGEQQQGKRVWVSSSTCSFAIYHLLSSILPSHHILSLDSPIALAKAVKNDAELAGLKAAHVRDGVAVVRFLSWLNAEMEGQGAAGYFQETPTTLKRKSAPSSLPALTEVSVADKLEKFRAEQQHFRGPSFATISSVGSNAAIIHYKPKEGDCATLDPSQIYLCDSGGQYLDGTTDVTRTVHFGMPSAHEKKCFTLVLKGVINLDTAIFPNGTTGHVLDILARTALWREGLDYRHGTGHGVGSYLNVHEGPHLISFLPKAQNVPMQASMTVTNEPGYYEDGKFGIRTENVMVVKEVTREFNFGEKGFLGFESVTFVPIQVKLIDVKLLTDKEVDWLNVYHEKCREKLSQYLDKEDLDFLVRATKPVVSWP